MCNTRAPTNPASTDASTIPYAPRMPVPNSGAARRNNHPPTSAPTIPEKPGPRKKRQPERVGMHCDSHLAIILQQTFIALPLASGLTFCKREAVRPALASFREPNRCRRDNHPLYNTFP